MFQFDSSNPVFKEKFNGLVDRVAKALAVRQDKLSEQQLVDAIRQMILSQDFKLLVTKPVYQPVQVSPTEFVVEQRQSIVYIPYEGREQVVSEFERYKKVVNSIINEEQRETLAQKLHEINSE